MGMAGWGQGVAALAMILAALPTQGWGQEVVARSAVEGRAVELLADGSWRYAGPTAPGACVELPEGYAFCGADEGWDAVPSPTPQVTAAFFRDNRTFGQFIIENIGSDDGVTFDGAREIILFGAAGAGGVRPEDVPVLDVFKTRAGDATGEALAYEVTIAGLTMVFVTTVFIRPRSLAQATTWTIGPDLDDADRAAHDEFLALTQVPE